MAPQHQSTSQGAASLKQFIMSIGSGGEPEGHSGGHSDLVLEIACMKKRS